MCVCVCVCVCREIERECVHVGEQREGVKGVYVERQRERGRVCREIKRECVYADR